MVCAIRGIGRVAGDVEDGALDGDVGGMGGVGP